MNNDYRIYVYDFYVFIVSLFCGNLDTDFDTKKLTKFFTKKGIAISDARKTEGKRYTCNATNVVLINSFLVIIFLSYYT